MPHIPYQPRRPSRLAPQVTAALGAAPPAPQPAPMPRPSQPTDQADSPRDSQPGLGTISLATYAMPSQEVVYRLFS